MDDKCRHIATLNNGINHYEKWCRVYSIDAVCPGINTRYQYNSLILIEREDEKMEEEKIRLKNNTRQGYLEGREWDGVVLDQDRARGRIQPEMTPTLNCGGGCGTGVIVKKNEGENMDSNEVDRMVEDGTLTVRRLTSRECWRLMSLSSMNEDGSFDDTNYEKAAEVSSEAQLYKQAGNSIVVDCLYAIFEKMLVSEDGPKNVQTTLAGYRGRFDGIGRRAYEGVL